MSEKPFFIGKWRIEPALNRAILNHKTVRFEPRLMKILVLLATHQGEVVSKDDLLDKVWPDLNVTEESLTQALSQIRKILAKDTSVEVFIQTVSKKGYLLVPEVRPTASVFKYKIAAFAAAMMVLGILLWPGLWTALFGQAPFNADQLVHPLPLTSREGRENDPAISEDGTLIVYSHGEKNQGKQIYLHALGAGAPDRKLTSTGDNSAPVFIPGKDQIAFMRKTDKGCQIISLDLLRAGERVLGNCLSNEYPDLAINHEGSLLAFSSRPETHLPNAIFIHNLATGETRQATFPPQETWGDYDPAFAAADTRLLFARAFSEAMQDILEIELNDGAETRLTYERRNIFGITEMAGEVVFASNRGGLYNLWRLDRTTQNIVPFPLAANETVSPAATRAGNAFVFERLDSQGAFLRIDLEANVVKESLKPFNASLFHPDISPNGETVVFASDRSGFYEIWESDLSGENFRMLTAFEGGFSAYPRYSPDGRRIAFSAQADETSQIYILDLDGRLTALTPPEYSAYTPTWSQDGSRIYFSADRDGQRNIWRLEVETGATVRMTETGGFFAAENSKGEVFVVRPSRNGLWRFIAGEEEFELLVPDLTFADWGNWTVRARKIYYFDRQERMIKVYNLDGGSENSLIPISGNIPFSDPLLAVSLDESILLFGVLTQVESDLYLGRLKAHD